MRSSTAVGLAAARGRFTSMPRYIIGAVSMKISRSTSTTSTRGMMLISAIGVPSRRSPSDAPGLNAIFGRSRQLADRTAEDVQEVQHEPVHLGRPVPHAIDEEVVADDRGDGGGETGGGGDQRLRDAGRHDREAGRALAADPLEGRHDAPHGAEEADERRGTRRGG